MSEANNFLSNSNFDFSNKRVLIRIDCDVDLREENGRLIVDEDFRLQQVLPTLKFLEKAGSEKIIIIGHLGRPAGQPDKKHSLAPIADWFSENFNNCELISFNNRTIEQLSNFCLLNNLRFHSGEIENNQKFAQKLASLADVYINEAFATSHRSHASIVGLPEYLPSFLGLNFEKEINNLTKIKNQAQRPLVIVLGGAKKGKVNYIPFLADLADTLLIGGKLPLLKQMLNDQMENVKWAGLKDNGKDLSQQDIQEFKNAIHQAQSIFMAGPLGVFEEEDNRQGTVEIVQTIAKSNAFKLAAGGDTHQVLSWLDLWDKFDFVSTGGGAALQFLRDETLPGIEAISNSFEVLQK